MSMVINNNLNAMNAHNNLARNVLGTRRASERLSSGLRVNRAADDAAGLAVSESMRSQLRGLGQAIRNANDGISLIQTAEGALEETHAMLHRLQELAVQSGNDTYNNTDRAQIQREVLELLNEITRIGTETNFNGVRLFNGTRGTNNAVDAGGFLIDGEGAVNSLGLAVNGSGSAMVAIAGGADGDPAIDGTMPGGAQSNVSVPDMTSEDTDIDNYLQVAGDQFLRYSSNTERNDGWFDSEHADVVGGITLQIGTNAAASQRLVLTFGDMTTTGLGLQNLDLTSLRGAQIALGIQSEGGRDMENGIEDADTQIGDNTLSNSSTERFVGPFVQGSIQFAINLVSGQRAQLGAWQNRLESTVSNLTVTHENLTSAESQIRDADMAAEMIDFTRFNILQQAAQAMLAQANQAPQAVLQLLR